jgi:hypothetical protein
MSTMGKPKAMSAPAMISVVILVSGLAMLQAPLIDGLSFDPALSSRMVWPKSLIASYGSSHTLL